MNAPLPPSQARPETFRYAPMFPLGPSTTPWRKLDIAGVSTATCDGQTVLRVKPDALSELAFHAFRDVSHLLRPAHLRQLRAILDDPEASANDRFVALDLLKNANVAAGGVLPMCQDTGTALVFGKKGQRIWVEGDEEEALSYGVHRTYTETNLRYSQMAPLSMFEEVNTGNNLPVQFDIMAAPGEHHADEMLLVFVAKGGGSANKSFLFQETRAILSPAKLLAYLETRIKTLGRGPHSRRRAPATSCKPSRPSSSAAPRPSSASRRSSSPRPSGSTACPRRGVPPGTLSATSTWSGKCWSSPANAALAPSSAASISATTSA
ncbi:MAG: hypothetical protein NVS2B11_04660 [Acetobacteraceae bacterium]